MSTPAGLTPSLKAKANEMPDKSTDPQATKPTIKTRLLTRFAEAITSLGKNWCVQLAAHNPYFDTRNGVNDCEAISAVVKSPRRADVDRIERVAEALEELVDTQKKEK